MIHPMKSLRDWIDGKLRRSWHEKRMVIEGAERVRILEMVMEHWYKIEKIEGGENMGMKIYLNSGATIAKREHSTWLENLKAAGRIYLDWVARETDMEGEYTEYPLSDITWS